MRMMFKALLGLMLFATAAPAFAQDQEIIVTGSRSRTSGVYGNAADVAGGRPVIFVKRTADFAVQQVTIVGDTRDQTKRREEIFAMVRSAIGLAGKFGVELATGQYVAEPLTLENYRNLPLSTDNDRDDTDSVTFLIKTPLAGTDAKAALERISKFIAAVPAVGRAEMKADDDLSLSVVNPGQYRPAIIDLVATDANATASKFGPGYGVQVSGLDRPVQWTRASLTEVLLYLPASYTVVPKN